MEGVLAVIWMFGGNFAPRNWAFCQGQLLPIAQNQALFSLLGTTYGGDGRTTFGLPNLQGRVPMGAGNGPGLSGRRIGEMGGVETVVLNTNEIPSHSHATTVNVSNAPGEESTVSGQVIANHAGAFSEEPVAGQTLGGVTSAAAGGNQAHTNVQPYTVVNYVICMNGLFPSRS